MSTAGVKQTLIQWDSFLLTRIYGWHGKRVLDGIMRAFSRLGDGYVYGVMAAILLVTSPHAAAVLLPRMILGLLIVIPLQKVLKNRFRRIRPCHTLPDIKNLIRPPDEFSFPSGHTAAAFMTAVLISRTAPHLCIPVFAAALMIGVSRIYNGVHYPTDVAAGALLGFIGSIPAGAIG